MADASKINPENVATHLQNVEPGNFTLEAKPGVVGKGADTAVILLAGGKGRRMEDINNRPKPLLPISGKPVLAWSLDTFDSIPEVAVIVLVCPNEQYKLYLDEVVSPFKYTTPILLAPAGETRQESAFNGLEMLPPAYKYVMVHDAARPLIPASLINLLHSVMLADPELDGAISAYPAIDSLKVVEGDKIVGSPDRKAIWIAQTPQIFQFETFSRAHTSALCDGFVGEDDSSLVERIGGNVICVHGKRNNIKLTVPEDYLALSGVIDYLKIEHGSEYDG